MHEPVNQIDTHDTPFGSIFAVKRNELPSAFQEQSVPYAC